MKKREAWLSMLVLVGLLIGAPAALGQTRPYMGFVYPAGGRQGTTFQVKVGGQSLNLVTDVRVTGTGVTAKIVERFKRIGPQEMTLMGSQLREFKDQYKLPPKPDAPPARPGAGPEKPAAPPEVLTMIARLEKRMEEYCNRPASNALAELVFLEVTIAPDAAPGEREIRLAMPTGVSNPMAFHVGQFTEFTRKPMLTANYQVLGKEDLALRKRPPEEEEVVVTPPCTMNGQIASGEVNKYRFTARKGQRLVISALARQLIPFMADAVPGWFQPVLTVYDSNGKEIVYKDDFRFKPDPVLLFEAPKDGEYIAAITDAIHRGREDFVYRITMGELPFVTSIFPLGGHVGETPNVKVEGWNLAGASLVIPAKEAGPGIHSVAAKVKNIVSNAVPFALDTLPEACEQEPNDADKTVQKVKLPIIINGRITPPNDQDVFEFEGRAGESIAVEVAARRLDSPMDSVIKITTAGGALLAVNDDYEDLAAGVNTHHADSYALLKLPVDGLYRVHLGDTIRAGGDEYGYRLRISKAGPEFALRVVPSSISIRSKSANALTVYVARRDGYTGPIKLELKDPPPGISCVPVTIPGDRSVGRLTVKTDLDTTPAPVNLTVVGSVEFEGNQIRQEAVPTEDRMQAFLWRHLVPAFDLQAVVFDPAWKPVPERVLPPPSLEVLAATREIAAKFTKNQVIGRLREIDQLYQERLLTDDFASKRVAEATVNDDLPTDVLTKVTAMAQAAVVAEKDKVVAAAKEAEDTAKATTAAAVKAAEDAAKAKAAAVAMADEAAKAKVAAAKAAEEARVKAKAIANAPVQTKATAVAAAKAAETTAKAEAVAAAKAAESAAKTKAVAVAKATEETKAKTVAARADQDARTKVAAVAKAEEDAKTKVAALAKAAEDAKVRVAAAKAEEETKTMAAAAKAAEEAKTKAVTAAVKAEQEAKTKMAAANAVKDPKARAVAAKAADEANAKAAAAVKIADEAKSTAATAAKALGDAQAKSAVAKAALEEMAKVAAAAKAAEEAKAKAAVEKAAEETRAKAAAAAKAAEEAKAKAAKVAVAESKPAANPAKAPGSK